MPNVAMITVTRPEFSEQQADAMGQFPVVMLTVEDISNENLTLRDYAEKSKSMALTQMMMMTGGMMQPQLSFDDQLSVGPFDHCLEYGINHPQFAIQVCNVLGIHDGLAYVFQIMGNPSVLTKYKSDFMEMARSCQFRSGNDEPLGVLRVHTGAYVVDTNPAWAVEKPEGQAIASFKTPSHLKPDLFSVYEGPCPLQGGETNPKTHDGVRVATIKEGSLTCKVYSYGPFTAVLKPLSKAESDLSNDWPIRTIKSVKRDSLSPCQLFVNQTHGYQFAVTPGSMFIASKVGGGTVVYFPLGKPLEDEQSMEQNVTVTIRVGTPETDPDCAESLSQWEERLRSEGQLLDIHREKLCDQDCVVFSSKEMQETGPGQRTEVQSKVYILVRGRTTTLIRWESHTGLWRRHESKLNQMIESFKLL
jgi:hypothetical protein